MTECLETDETVLYRLKKSRTPIVFMVIFYPIWIYFGSVFLKAYIGYLFLGLTDAPPTEYLAAGLIVLVIVLPLLLVIFLSYTLNSLVITDRYVYIRKGMTGRTQIVSHGDIRSFQHAYSTGRNHSNHRIFFYLYSGQCVKTGQLFITLGGLTALMELLRGRFEGRGFELNELKALADENPAAGRAVSKTNVFIVILMILPFLLALTAVVLYMLDIRF